MNQSKKIILMMVTIMVLIGGYLSFRIFIYTGYVTIETISAPFQVSFSDFGQLTCKASPCKFRVPPREYEVILSKEGYSDYSDKIKISFRKEIKWNPVLKLIPALSDANDLANKFAPKFAPHPPVGENPYGIRDADLAIFYLDKTDGKFYEGIGGDKKFLVEFTGIQDAQIIPADNYVFLISGKEVFEVNLKTRRKFKIFEGGGLQALSTYGDSAILTTSTATYVKLGEEKEFRQLPQTTDINLACMQDDKIMLASYKEDSGVIRIDFWAIDPKTLTEESIASSTGAVKPRKTLCESDGLLLVQLESEEIYQLRY